MAKKRNSVNGNTKKRPRAPKGSRVGVQNLELRDVEPMTNNQADAFDAWESGSNLMLSGFAGTGKTFLASFFALSTGLKVCIVRSAVQGRDMGFMPGSSKEKTSYYEAPYVDSFAKLFGRGDAYELMTQKGAVEFMSTSFLRGITLDNCVVVIDEIQNMTAGEINTIITRIGVNSRLIILGDFRQTDLNKRKEKSGFRDVVKILGKVDKFTTIDFGVEDIVRSDFVKRFLIARAELEDLGEIEVLD